MAVLKEALLALAGLAAMDTSRLLGGTLDTSTPKPSPAVRAQTLPDCSSKEIAASRRPIVAKELERLIDKKALVHVRGKLGRLVAGCTLVGGISNGCDYDWIVSPRAECPEWQLVIRGIGIPARLARGGWDHEVGTSARSMVEVIVAGRLAADGARVLVEEAEICRLPDRRGNREAALPTDRLTDEEADRIASRVWTAGPVEPCPRFVPKRPPPRFPSVHDSYYLFDSYL